MMPSGKGVREVVTNGNDATMATIIIQLYRDLDCSDADRHFIPTSPPDAGHFAEDMCLQAAEHLEIDPLAFHLLALATPDLARYYSPDERITETTVLRVRLFPPDLPRVADNHPALVRYLFQQCRHDLTSGVICLPEAGREHLLGLAVLDMFRLSQKLGVVSRNLPYTPDHFLPPASRRHFRMPWRQMRLRRSVHNQLSAQSRLESYGELELEYVIALSQYAPSYGVERFALQGGGSVIVDTRREVAPGLYIENNSKQEFICAIEDLLGVEMRDAFSIHIFRRYSIPRGLTLDEEGQMRSFISLLSALYRLTYDFQQPLCEQLKSPMISALKRLRCHGPVKSSWAIRALQQCHLAVASCNYLLKQKRRVHGSYVIVHLPLVGAPPELINVAKLADNRYQVSSRANQPIFPSMQQLLAFYSSAESPRWIRLQTCVVPTNPCPPDAGVYLCKRTARPIQDGRQLQPAHTDCRAAVITSVELLGIFGQGRYTEVHQGHTDNRKTVVAVKLLKDMHSDKLQWLQQSVHSAICWRHEDIVSVHSVCLASPFRAVSEFAPLGSLDAYLHSARQLKVFHLVAAVESIAQALFYLEELVCSGGPTAGVHGAIRSRNVLVFAHEGAVMRVKLGDPGLIHYYSSLPVDSSDNVERLPWIAPENYLDLAQMTPSSDIYSFGTFLWEVFSIAQRPHAGCTHHEIMQFVQSGQYLDQPMQCPHTMYTLMTECWQLSPSDRPSAKHIVCKVKSLLSKVDVTNTYSDPTWSGIELPHSGSVAQNAANDARHDCFELLHQSVLHPGGQFDSHVPLLDDVSGCSQSNGGIVSLTAMAGVMSRQPLEADSGLNSDMNGAHLEMSAFGEKSSSIQWRPLPEVPTRLQNELRSDQVEMLQEKQLGRGHYGIVYKGRLYDSEGRPTSTVAIKCLHKSMHSRCIEEFEREICMMQTLDHPNIVSIIGHLPPCAEHPLRLVMEFVAQGCLSMYLKEHKDSIQPSTLLQFGSQIAQGMYYLSSKNIVHRDLAARNILVTQDERMKISDFGLSRYLAPQRDYYRSGDSKEIPAPWCAPEGLRREFRSEGDVWSYGITLWEIFSYGATPVLCKLDRLAEALHKGERLRRPCGTSLELYNLMRACWEYYPDKRITFAAICDRIEEIISECGGLAMAGSTR